MAQRDLNRRFSEALLGLRNGLTVSLPLAGPFGERLFFYQAVRSPEGTLQLFKRKVPFCLMNCFRGPSARPEPCRFRLQHMILGHLQ